MIIAPMEIITGMAKIGQKSGISIIHRLASKMRTASHISDFCNLRMPHLCLPVSGFSCMDGARQIENLASILQVNCRQ